MTKKRLDVQEKKLSQALEIINEAVEIISKLSLSTNRTLCEFSKRLERLEKGIDCDENSELLEKEYLADFQSLMRG